MPTRHISYRSLRNYKYQMVNGYGYKLPDDLFCLATGKPFNQGEANIGLWVRLDWTMRTLHISRGYCWDGPSGPTIDTENFMRGSLVHDALYQLMREHSFYRQWRDDADQILKRICLEDGMSKVRAAWVYWGVKTWGRRAAGG